MDALKRYLKLKNWVLVNAGESSLYYEGPVDDLKQPIRLVLPVSTEFADAPDLISKAVGLLSAIERESVENMSQIIMNSD